MATNILTYNEIIEKARLTWPGAEGDERAERVKQIVDTRLENYSNVTGFSKEEILIALERARDVNTVNFYQANRLPLLENTHFFDTLSDLKEKFPSGKYICPNCEKISTDPYRCTQPDCDWKVYGLFGDLGKGIKIIVKELFLDHPFPEAMFKPIELK